MYLSYYSFMSLNYFFGTSVGLKYEPSRMLATTTAIVSEIPSQIFNDARFLENAPQRLLYITKIKIHVRRWDGRPIIGGDYCCQISK